MGANNIDTFGYVTFFNIQQNVVDEDVVGSTASTVANFVNLTNIGAHISEISEYVQPVSLGAQAWTIFTIPTQISSAIWSSGYSQTIKLVNKFGFRNEQGTVRGFQPAQNPDVEVSGSTIPFPATIPGLSMWFDASDSSTISSGAGIDSWTSKIGTTVATQSTPANRPDIDYVDGKQMIRFLRVNAESLGTSTIPSISPPFTIFTVENIPDDTNYQTSHMLSLNSTNYYGMFPRGDATEELDWWREAGAINVLSGPSYPTGVNFITVIAESGSSGASLQLNNETVVTTSTSIDVSPTTLTFGTWIFGAGFEHNGRIAEYLLYNRGLTVTETESIKAYLQNKWL